MKKTKKKNNLAKFIMFSLLLIPIVGVTVKLNESSPGSKPIINVPAKNENVSVDYDNETIQTSNIKIVKNVEDLQNVEKNKLCILNESSNLSFKVFNNDLQITNVISNQNIDLSNTIYEPIVGVYNNCIYYGLGQTKNTSNSPIQNTDIYKYDLSSNTITKVKSILNTIYGCGAVVGNKLYSFYGAKSSSNVDIVNLDTLEEQYLTGTGGRFNYSNQCCAVVGTDIYVFGGSYYNNYNDYYNDKVTKFDTLTNTATVLSTSVSGNKDEIACSIGTDIYIFAGSYGGVFSKSIYKFDTILQKWSGPIASLPVEVTYGTASAYGKYIFIFSGNNIILFNSENKTSAVLDYSSSISFQYAGSTSYLDNIYIIGGDYNKNNYTFTFPIDLPTNEVYIYTNDISVYSFDLNDQVSIPIKNIYIGDSNNTAQLVDAYLYDESQTAWINVNTGLPLEVGDSNA